MSRQSRVCNQWPEHQLPIVDHPSPPPSIVRHRSGPSAPQAVVPIRPRCRGPLDPQVASPPLEEAERWHSDRAIRWSSPHLPRSRRPQNSPQRRHLLTLERLEACPEGTTSGGPAPLQTVPREFGSPHTTLCTYSPSVGHRSSERGSPWQIRPARRFCPSGGKPSESAHAASAEVPLAAAGPRSRQASRVHPHRQTCDHR